MAGELVRDRRGSPMVAVLAVPLALVLALAGPAAAAPSGAGTVLVSVSAAGTRSNSGSLLPTISADGEVIAFTSWSTDLVPGDTNGWRDVFVRDLRTGGTERVSVSSDGTQGNGPSGLASISADGRYVAFSSEATNLVRADTNRAEDVFVHDRVTRTTQRVSVASRGAQGHGDSWGPKLSADGRFVAFNSTAANLVTGDRNGRADVFVRDLVQGMTTRVSVATGGGEADGFSFDPGISADGRYVTFTSAATNLVPQDGNKADDVFRHHILTGETVLVSVGLAGGTASGFSSGARPSADGRFVAFASDASDLVAASTGGMNEIYVRDLVALSTRLVTVARGGRASDGNSLIAELSADGRYVAFESDATNLVKGDRNGVADVFVADLARGTIALVSLSDAGKQARDSSFGAAISADGRYVAFTGWDPGLVSGYPDARDPDVDGTIDVYRRGPLS